MWRYSSDWWGRDSLTFDSPEELADAIAEAKFPPPVLEEVGDELRVRYYEDYAGLLIYEGMKEFESEEWLHRGTNWHVVAVRVE
ncbi:MAG: hypothetical protein KatS3mg063_2673 [Tepidiforma sp.]|uniref:hypothetical protein n=1 Tax=Tepidiforma sp. TaxID=2682230 RepID=UPI0021DEECA1|nr:hypothetical protein [Tepidiforma sp.]GIV93836.1 MAG: hypothetical protein KatS3mg056_2545 [Chloroflexus sp.]GIW16820.1 MAG: hypothetical protein KatS3mg063_2673 [Tepidiforma sp.]